MPTYYNLEWPVKEVGDVLDYSLELADEVEPGDQIAQVLAAIAPTGAGELVIDGNPGGEQVYVSLGNVIVLWLSDGVAGRTYEVRLLVYMVSGRIFDIYIELPMSRIRQVYPQPDPPNPGYSAWTVWGADMFSDNMVFGGAGAVAVEALVV